MVFIINSCETALGKQNLLWRHIQDTNIPFYFTKVDTAPGKTSWRPLLYTNQHQLHPSGGKVAEKLFFLKYMFFFEPDGFIWCSVVRDATETFVFWTSRMTSVSRAVHLIIFTTGKFKGKKISKIKDQFYKT